MCPQCNVGRWTTRAQTVQHDVTCAYNMCFTFFPSPIGETALIAFRSINRGPIYMLIQGLAKYVYAGTGFMLPTPVTSHDKIIIV